MKATLKCKAESLKELLPKSNVTIEKTILLDKQDFTDFSYDLLEDWGFIKENKKSMFSDMLGEHCLLIMYDGADFGILVQSEGYDYARYTAYIEIWEDTPLGVVEKYPKELFDDEKTTPF